MPHLPYENLRKIGVKAEIKNYDLYIYGSCDLKKGSGYIKHNDDHRDLNDKLRSNPQGKAKHNDDERERNAELRSDPKVKAKHNLYRKLNCDLPQVRRTGG